jgi:hypothetical protein
MATNFYYTTTFPPPTESPISQGGVWTHNGTLWTKVDTDSGQLAHGTQTGSGGFDDSYAYLSNFPADHGAAGVVHLDPSIDTGTTHEVEILLRWLDGTGPDFARGYECNLAYNAAYADVVRWNGALGSFDFIVHQTGLGITVVNGGTFSARIQGNNIQSFWTTPGGVTTKIVDVQIDSISGTVWTTGNPGMGFWRGAPSVPHNDYCFSKYTASAIVTCPVGKLSCSTA